MTENVKLGKAVVIEIAVMRILVVILQLVFLKIYSNYTSTYELGIYFFLITISYSLNAFLLVPLDYFQQSQLYKLKNSNLSLKSFNSLNWWVLKFASILLIAGLITCFFIDKSYCYLVPFIVLLAVSIYFVNLVRGFINNLEKRRFAIYCILGESILKILFYLLYLKIFHSSATIILGSLLSASLVTLVFLVWIFTRLKEYKVNQIIHFNKKDIFAFSYPISIGSVINWIQLQGYRMILVPLGLVEIVGIYATVANVGTNGMNAYATIFNQIFIPYIYKSNGAYIKTYVRNALLSIIFVLICGYGLSNLIVGILTKQEFVKYSSLIIYGVISEGANFLIGPLTIYLTLHSLTKVSIMANIVGLLTFCASFFLLYIFKKVSVQTIGLPIILTQIVITLYLVIIVYRIIKEKKLANE